MQKLLKTDQNSFPFSAPKMVSSDGFAHFRFQPKVYFAFSAKNDLKKDQKSQLPLIIVETVDQIKARGPTVIIVDCVVNGLIVQYLPGM